MMTGGNGHSSAQIGNSTAITKNGIQHTTKAPVIIASVLAAFRSRLELVSLAEGVFFFNIDGLDLLRSLLKFGEGCGFFHEASMGWGGQLIFEGYATDILSDVGGSTSIRSSSPLP